MKRIAALSLVLFVAAACTTTEQRIGGAAVGAGTGAVVAGPVGAVAGGAVGAIAAPSVTRSARRASRR